MRILLMAAVVLSLSACGSDDPAGLDDNGPSNGSFRATVDGSAFNAASISVAAQGGIIGIGSADVSGRSFGLGWQDNGTGTYTISTTVPTNGIYTEGSRSWVASTIGGSGAIVVIERTNSRIRGTFSFTMVPTAGSGATGNRTVTQGSFDVTF